MSGTWAPLFLKRDNPASRIICLQQCLFNLRLFYAASCGLVSRIFLLLYDYIAEPALRLTPRNKFIEHLKTSSTKACRTIEVIGSRLLISPVQAGVVRIHPNSHPRENPAKLTERWKTSLSGQGRGAFIQKGGGRRFFAFFFVMKLVTKLSNIFGLPPIGGFPNHKVGRFSRVSAPSASLHLGHSQRERVIIGTQLSNLSTADTLMCAGLYVNVCSNVLGSLSL